MSKTRLPMSHEALFKFIASSVIFLREKDKYLDGLVSQEAGKKFVQDTLQITINSISKYEKIRLMSIWAQNQNDKDIVSMKLRVCKYVRHHLRAALDKPNPTIESVYYYLLNSEREDKDKVAYLRYLDKTKNGDVLIHLTKSYARKRQSAMESLFGVDAAYFESDQLDSYPAAKLSAKDVFNLLDTFKLQDKTNDYQALSHR